LHGVNYDRENASGRGRIPKETNGIGETEENDRDRITLRGEGEGFSYRLKWK